MDLPPSQKVSVTKSRYSPTPQTKQNSYLEKLRTDTWSNNDKLKKPGFANQFKQSDIVQEQHLQKFDNFSAHQQNPYNESNIQSAPKSQEAIEISNGSTSHHQKQLTDVISNKILSELKKSAQTKVNNYLKNRTDSKEMQGRNSSQPINSGDNRFQSLFPTNNNSTLLKQNQAYDPKYQQNITIPSMKYQDTINNELLKQMQADNKNKTQSILHPSNSGQKYAYSQNASPMSTIKAGYNQVVAQPQQQSQQVKNQQQLQHYATLVAQSNLIVQNMSQQQQKQEPQQLIIPTQFQSQQQPQQILQNNIGYKSVKQEQPYRYGKVPSNQASVYDNTPLFPIQQQKAKETFYQKLITDRNFQNFNQKLQVKKNSEPLSNQVSPNQTITNNFDNMNHSPQTVNQGSNYSLHSNYQSEFPNRNNSYVSTATQQRNLSAHNSPQEHQLSIPKTLQFITYNNKYQPVIPQSAHQKKESLDSAINHILKSNLPQATIPIEQLEMRHRKQLDQYKQQAQRYEQTTNSQKGGKAQMSISEHHTPRNNSDGKISDGVRSSSMQKRSYDNLNQISSQENLQMSGGKFNEKRQKPYQEDLLLQNSQQASNKIEKYQQEIELYQKELSNVKYELDTLKNQQSNNSDLDFLNKQLHNLKSIFLDKKKQLELEIEQSNQTHKQLKEKLNQALQSNQHLQNENIMLKNQLSLQTRGSNEKNKSGKSDQQQIMSFDNENQNLKKDIFDLKTMHNKEIEELKEKYQDYIFSLEEKSNLLKKQLDDQRNCQQQENNIFNDNQLLIREMDAQNQIIEKQSRQINELENNSQEQSKYISDLEQKIRELEEQVQYLSNQLYEQEEKFEQHLTEQLQLSIQKEQENLQKQRNEIEAEMNAAFAQRIEQEIKSAQGNGKEEAEQTLFYQTQLRNVMEDYDQARIVIQNLQQNNQDANDEIDNLRSQLEQALDDLKSASSTQGNDAKLIQENQELIQLKKELEKINNELTSEIFNFEKNDAKQRDIQDKLQTEIDSLKQQLDQIGKEHLNTINTITLFKQNSDSQQSEITQLNQIIEDQQKEIQKLLSDKNDLEHYKNNAEENLAIKSEEYENYKNSLNTDSQNDKEREDLKEIVANLKKQVEDLESQLSDKDFTLLQKQQTINQMNAEKYEVSAEKDKLIFKIEELEEIVINLKKQNKLAEQEKNDNLRTSEAQQEELNGKIKDQDIKINNLKRLIQDMQQQLDDSTVQIEQLQQEQLQKELNLSRQHSMNNDYIKEIQALSKQIYNQQALISEQKQQVDDLRTQTAQLVEFGDQKDQKIAELENLVQKYEKEINQYQEKEMRIQEVCPSLEASVSPMNINYQNREKEEKEKQQSMEQQQDEVQGDAKDQQLQLEIQIEELKEKLSQFEQDSIEFQQKVKLQEDIISQLNQEKDNLQQEKEALEQQVEQEREEKERQASALQDCQNKAEEKQQLEVQIEELEQKLSECQLSITSLQQKIQQQEDEISKLQENKFILEQDNQQFEKMTQQFNEEHSQLQAKYQNVLAFYNQAVEERETIKNQQQEFEIIAQKAIEDKYTKEYRFLQETHQSREFEFAQIIEQKENLIKELAQKVKDLEAQESPSLENTQLTHLQRELKDKKDKLSVIEELSIEQQKAIKSLDLEKKECEKIIKKLNDKLDFQRQEYDQQQLLVDRYQKELFNIRSQNEVNENQLKNFKMNKSQLEEQIKELEDENAKLKQKETEQAEKIEEIENSLKNLLNSKKFREEQRQSQTQEEQEIESLKIQNQDLQNQLVEKILDFQMQIDELQQDKDLLLKKKIEKEQRVDELIEQNDKISELCDKLNSQIEQQLLVLRENEENEVIVQEQLANYKIQIEEHKQINEKLQIQSGELATQNENFSIKIQILENQVETLSEENKSLKERLAEKQLPAESHPLSKQSSSELNTPEMGCTNADKAVDLTQDQLDLTATQNQENIIHTQKKKDSEDFQKSQQTEENPILQQNIKQEDQNGDVFEKDETIKNLKNAIEELKTQFSQKEQMLNQKVHHYKDKKRQYREKLKLNEQKYKDLQFRVQADTKALQARIDAFEEEQRSIQNESQVQINDLLAQKVTLYQENQKLQEKISLLNEQLKRQELVLHETQRQLRNEQSTRNDSDGIDSDVEAKNNEIESLSEDKKLLKEELQQKDQLIYQYMEENSELEKQVQNLQKQLESHQSSPNEADLQQMSMARNETTSSTNEENIFKEEEVNQTIQMLKEQIQILNEHSQEKENSLATLQDSINTYLNEKSDYERQIQQLVAQNKNLEAILEETSSLQEEIKLMQEQYEKVQKEVISKDELIVQLQQELANQKDDLRQNQGESDADTSVQKQKFCLEEELKVQENEHQQDKQKIQELKDEIEQLKEKMEEYKEQCNFSEERVSQLMEECSAYGTKMAEREEEFNQQIDRNEEYYMKLLKRKNEEYSDLYQQFDELNEESYNLREQIEKLQQNNSCNNDTQEIATLKEKIEKLQQEKDMLGAEKNLFENKQNEANQQIKDLNLQLETLKKDQELLKSLMNEQAQNLIKSAYTRETPDQKDQQETPGITAAPKTENQRVSDNFDYESPEITPNKQKKFFSEQDEENDSLGLSGSQSLEDQVKELKRQLNERNIKISNLEGENLDLEDQIDMLYKSSQQHRENLDKQYKESYQNEYTLKCQNIRKSYRSKIKQIEENKKQEMNELKAQIQKERSQEMKMIKEKLGIKIQLLDEAYKMQIQQVREEEQCKYNELLMQIKQQYELEIKELKQGSNSITNQQQSNINNENDLLDLSDNNPFNSPDQSNQINPQPITNAINLFEEDEEDII